MMTAQEEGEIMINLEKEKQTKAGAGILFLLYVNDVPYSSDLFKFILFADDTTALYSHNNLAHLIQRVNDELPKINDWFLSNKLALNLSKTNYIIFRSQRKYFNDSTCKVYIDDQLLECKHVTKFLGVEIDQYLSWDYLFKFVI